MQIISQFAPLPLAQPEKGTAVAMGYFDGIHIGHRAVIEGAVQWAKTHDAAPAVFTFRLPVENKMKGKRLLSTEDKHALIHSLGVEYYLTPDFEAIKALSPEEFVRGIVENCHARALFCGENFTFGAKAAGTPELLRTLCAPLGVDDGSDIDGIQADIGDRQTICRIVHRLLCPCLTICRSIDGISRTSIEILTRSPQQLSKRLIFSHHIPCLGISRSHHLAILDDKELTI